MSDAFWKLPGGFGALPYGARGLGRGLLHALTQGRLAEMNLPGAPVLLRPEAASRAVAMADLRPAFRRPPQAQDLSNAEAQLTYFQTALADMAGAHDLPLRGLIGAYFDHVRARIAQQAAQLAARSGALAGLVQPMHWAFLAPMPLPLAHPSPASANLATAVGDTVPQIETVPCIDLAFCTDAGLIALFAPRGTPTPRSRRARAALVERGVTLHECTQGEDLGAVLTSIDPIFADFTASADLPRSPFGGPPIPAPRL